MSATVRMATLWMKGFWRMPRRQRYTAEPAARTLESFGRPMLLDEYLVTRIVELSIHVDERYLKEGRLDRNSLDLIGRMGGMQYTRTTERFEIVRPKVE